MDLVAGVDLKAQQLIGQLRTIAAEARRPSRSGVPGGDRRKTIVFSTFADTIDVFDAIKISRWTETCKVLKATAPKELGYVGQNRPRRVFRRFGDPLGCLENILPSQTEDPVSVILGLTF